MPVYKHCIVKTHVVLNYIANGYVWTADESGFKNFKSRQSQGYVERANRGIEDMLTTWLHSNATTHWADGLRFVQVMKNRAYHEGLKCSPYEAVFGQPMKVGLKTSNLPNDEQFPTQSGDYTYSPKEPRNYAY